MGIPLASARLLMQEAKERPLSGHVLQLGRSTVFFDQQQLERAATLEVFPLECGIEAAPSHDPRLAALGCIDDRSLFRQLGFDEVSACDVADWEDAEFIFDLNGEIPAELEGRFDVVFETGTIVQIFDLPKVLDNVFRLLRPGGRVVHAAVPSNNHMDLGFYMLCPSFFGDFYSANSWRIETHYLCEYYAYWHEGRLYSDRWKVFEYSPGCLDALSYGRYGGAQAATFLVATKADGATGDKTPQLGQYEETWSQYRDSDTSGPRVAGYDAGADGEAPRIPSPGRHRVLRPIKRVVEAVRRRLLRRRMPRLLMRL